MATTSVETALATWAATDAGFRIWGKAWHDTLIALGLSQEYSTIDFTTVTMPTVAQTEAGYRVYKMTDTACTDLYLKVGWARGSTVYGDYGYRINLTLGTTHNGSGTVGGYGFTAYITCQQASLADGGLVGARTETGIVLFTNVSHTASYQTGFVLERTSKAGVPNSMGYTLLTFGLNTDTTATSSSESAIRAVNVTSGTVFARLAVVPLAWAPPVVMPSTSTFSYNSKAPLAPIITFGDNDPLLNVVCTTYEQRGGGTVLSGTVNGISGTYRVPKNFAGGPGNFGVALKVA